MPLFDIAVGEALILYPVPLWLAVFHIVGTSWAPVPNPRLAVYFDIDVFVAAYILCWASSILVYIPTVMPGYAKKTKNPLHIVSAALVLAVVTAVFFLLPMVRDRLFGMMSPMCFIFPAVSAFEALIFSIQIKRDKNG